MRSTVPRSGRRDCPTADDALCRRRSDDHTHEVVRLLDEYRPDLFLLGLDRDPLDPPYVGQPLLEAAQFVS